MSEWTIVVIIEGRAGKKTLGKLSQACLSTTVRALCQILIEICLVLHLHHDLVYVLKLKKSFLVLWLGDFEAEIVQAEKQVEHRIEAFLRWLLDKLILNDSFKFSLLFFNEPFECFIINFFLIFVLSKNIWDWVQSFAHAVFIFLLVYVPFPRSNISCSWIYGSTLV